jgi:hypothetical protein
MAEAREAVGELRAGPHRGVMPSMRSSLGALLEALPSGEEDALCDEDRLAVALLEEGNALQGGGDGLPAHLRERWRVLRAAQPRLVAAYEAGMQLRTQHGDVGRCVHTARRLEHAPPRPSARERRQ